MSAFMEKQDGVVNWAPFHAIFHPSAEIALLQLNCDLDTGLACYSELWNKAKLRMATDGAVNALYRCGRKRFVPDFISGDFDSAKEHVLNYYKKQGSEVIPTLDQDESDFPKALRILTERIKLRNIKVGAIVVFGSHGGDCFDHVMGNIHTLYKAKAMTSLPVYLVTNSSVEFLLSQDEHVIGVDSPQRDTWCGLVPIGYSCNHVTTNGLKWNLNDQRLCFGELMSTSNICADDATRVRVNTDNFLLLTMGIKFT